MANKIKSWLEDQMAKKQELRATMKKQGMKSDNAEEVRKTIESIEKVDAEIREIEDQLKELEAEERARNEEEEKRKRNELNPPFDSQRPANEQRGNNTDPVVAANMETPAQQQPQGEVRSNGKFAYGFGGGHSEEARAREYLQKCEQRGQDLKDRRAVVFTAEDFPELRAVTIGSSNLVTQAKYSNILIPKFNEVSSIVDVVNAIPLQGGESYTQSFEISAGTAGYSAETDAYTNADPTFGLVSIGKSKITSYSEMTDEARKLPNVDYQSRVAASMLTAIRKKIAAEIMLGDGGSNHLTGIFNAPANVMPAASVDLEIAQIDENTLDLIVFSYGGDENVEGGQYLILNKNDLAAFAAVRSTTGQKLYNITLNGNTGTISSDKSYAVNFIINSACPALSASGTAVGTYCMAYGSPAVYEMPVFSQVEVMESLDFKFNTGQLAFRASVWCGGNTTKYRGFTRVKKVAAV